MGISLGSGLIYARLDPVIVTGKTTILLALGLGQVLLLFKSWTTVATLAGQHRFLVGRSEQPQNASPVPVVTEPREPVPVEDPDAEYQPPVGKSEEDS